MDLSNDEILHVKKDGIEYLQFRKLLNYPEIKHAYVIGLEKNFKIFANPNYEEEEKNNKAKKDYKKICKELNLDYNNIVNTMQKHTDNVQTVSEKINNNEPDFNIYKETDGLITNKKDIVLATINADCILIVFYDPVKKVIANIHSGWRGTLKRISEKTVLTMKNEFGSNPKDIICCMSPSIRKDHFEVDEDVYELFYDEFKDLKEGYKDIFEKKGYKWHIDTIQINRKILKLQGLKEENIIDSGICSVCNKELIHSYRAHGKGCRRGYTNNFCVKLKKNRKDEKMILPNKLNIGDTIGVVAPANPIINNNIEELNRAKKIIEEKGYKVKFSKNIFLNTNGYSATAKEKAQDINDMFLDNEVKMIWCAKGGLNSNSVLDYIDYGNIKNNPKIICGYSDITTIVNVIYQKTGLVTFSGTNFKTTATDETDYSLNEVLKRFVQGSRELGKEEDLEKTIKEGCAEGTLIGGNLSTIHGLTCGKYALDFRDKILFLEDLGLESEPSLVNNHLYYMKQNGVFNKIKGLWLGNYEHESGVFLEKIVLDVLEDECDFPIIKCDYFGHTEKKTVIPIGTKARIDTSKNKKIELIEECIKISDVCVLKKNNI